LTSINVDQHLRHKKRAHNAPFNNFEFSYFGS
jgi:hypothetical protein